MLSFKLKNQHMMQHDADLYVGFCSQNTLPENVIKDFSTLYAPLQEVIKTRNFVGAAGSQLLLAAIKNNKPVTLILVGIGSEKKSAADRLEYARRAMGLVIRAAESVKAARVAVLMPDHKWFGINEFELTKELVSVAMMAAYHFDQFITDPAHKLTRDIEILLCAPEMLHDQI